MPTLHERVTRLEASDAKHDKQIKAIRDLIHEGMRVVLRLAKENTRLQASVTELTNSLKRGANGHVKRKIDLQ